MPDRRYVYQVDIDVNQARRAAQQLRSVFEQELRTVNAGGVSAGGTTGGGARGGIGGMLGGMGGALGAAGLGLTMGVVASKTFAFAKELDSLNRQSRLAEQGLLALVGSADAVAERTRIVQDAMGGTISKIEAMQQATQLSALGFADTTAEMERFIRASQGASVATGRSTDYITQQLVLAISNQSLMRLDQLGLNASEVKQRISELKAVNAGWTQEMLYQEAVLGRLEEKYGALSSAAKENASGIAQLSAAWTDLKTSVSASGTVIDSVAGGLAGMGERLATVQFAINETKAASQSTVPYIQALGDEAYGIAWKVMAGAASMDELNAAMARLRAGGTASGRYFDEIPVRGKTRTHPDYIRPGALGDAIARPHEPRATYADTQAAEAKAYSQRLNQILAQDSWQKWETDKRLAELAAREWSSAADTAADAWSDAAEDFKNKLAQIPGLLGTSDVTGEQMNLASMGVGQDFADNYLRRLTDEVLNGVDWAGVDLGEAARLAGIDQGLPKEAQLAMFRQSWADSSLFANPEALGLINQDAVRAGLAQQERSEQGKANIYKLFGIEDDRQLTEAGASIGAGIRPGIIAGVAGGDEEGGGGAGLVSALGAEMQKDLGDDATRTSFMGVGVSVVNIIHAGFGEQAAKADWLGAITSALAAQAAGLTNGGGGYGGPAVGDPSGVVQVIP